MNTLDLARSSGQRGTLLLFEILQHNQIVDAARLIHLNRHSRINGCRQSGGGVEATEPGVMTATGV